MAPTRVLIDTDPGVDDAVAIFLALASPEIEVVGITAVAGNVPLAKTALNARRLLDLLDRHDIPVAAGCADPLSEAIVEDSVVHGHDGLGDLEWDEPSVVLDERHGVDLIADLALEAPLTVVAIGPLTNLASPRRGRGDRPPGDHGGSLLPRQRHSGSRVQHLG